MPLRAVLFDLDDTLHDKAATLRKVAGDQFLSANLFKHGIDQQDWQSEYLALNKRRIEKTQVFESLRQRFKLSYEQAAVLHKDFDENLGKSAQLTEGALDFVLACKRKFLKVGAVTNGRDVFQRSKIDGMGLKPHIDRYLWRLWCQEARTSYFSCWPWR